MQIILDALIERNVPRNVRTREIGWRYRGLYQTHFLGNVRYEYRADIEGNDCEIIALHIVASVPSGHRRGFYHISQMPATPAR